MIEGHPWSDLVLKCSDATGPSTFLCGQNLFLSHSALFVRWKRANGGSSGGYRVRETPEFIEGEEEKKEKKKKKNNSPAINLPTCVPSTFEKVNIEKCSN